MSKPNLENIRLLIDALRESRSYKQVVYFHECGTPACIAGHAVALACEGQKMPVSRLRMISYGKVSKCAAAFLGLDKFQACTLFDPNPLNSSAFSAMPRDATSVFDAIATLQQIIDTDGRVVKWVRAEDYAPPEKPKLDFGEMLAPDKVALVEKEEASPTRAAETEEIEK